MQFRHSLVIWLCTLFLQINLLAQTSSTTIPHYCGVHLSHEKQLYNNPDYAAQQQKINKQIAQATEKMREERLAKANAECGTPNVISIPVVIHLLYDAQTIPNENSANLEEERVHEAMRYINEAYRNEGYWDNTIGVDTEIEFCLASRTPNGSPTNGIIHHGNMGTFSNIDLMINNSGVITNPKDSIMKAQTGWNRLNYLNIWIIEEVCDSNIAGTANDCAPVAYSFLAHDHGKNIDGIVGEARFFGKDIHEMVVFIHEIGHYLNLEHTFLSGCPNNNCLLQGDYVCDTPPDASKTPRLCTRQINSCLTDDDDKTGNNPFAYKSDQLDMSENYMDYSNIACQNMFTAGQRDRMMASIMELRSSLLASNACQSFANLDIGISDIVSPTSFTCDANLEAVVTLTNYGTSNVQSAIINYKIDESATIYTFVWNGNLPAGASVNVCIENTLTLEGGNHQLSVYTTNPNNGVDALVANDEKNKQFSVGEMQNIPFYEDFESLDLAGKWTIVSNDEALSWKTNFVTGCTGNGIRSIYMNNFNYLNGIGQADYLYTYVDLSSSADIALTFDVAYVPYSDSFEDMLKVLVSSDCGETYQEVYKKSGQELGTIDGIAVTSFKPKNCSEWRTEEVDLSDFAGDQVVLAFVNISRYANNLYVDNVQIGGNEPFICEAPSDISLVNVNSNSANLAWTAITGAANYVIRYRRKGLTAWTTLASIMPNVNLENLKPDETYEITVQSICSGGETSEASPSFFFDTPDISCNPPTNINVTEIGINNATLSWIAFNEATSYNIEYRPANSNNWLNKTVTGTSTILINLLGNTNYVARIQSVCANGIVSEFVSTPSFITQLQCEIPTGLIVQSVGSNEVYLNWTVSNNGQVSYELQYRPYPDGGTWFSTTTTANFLRINNLVAGTEYEVRISAKCTGLFSSFSSPIVFMTNEYCTTPISLKSTNVSENSAQISWGAGQDALTYNVRYRPKGTTTWSYENNVTGTSINLTNLLSGSIYEFEVASICEGTFSDFSEAALFTTLANCEEPINLNISNVGETQASIQWDEVLSANSYLLRYRRTWPDEENNWTERSLQNPSTTLYNLQAGSMYEAQVSSLCNTSTGTDSSPFSDLAIFSTTGGCTIPTPEMVSNLGANSAVLHWSLVEESVGYDVRYRPKNGSGWQKDLVTPASQTDLLIDQLLPNMAYEFQVASVCSFGLTPYSSSYSFTTTAVNNCVQPTEVNIDTINESAALLSWTGNVSSYNLRYKSIEESDWHLVDNIITNTFNRNKLLPCTEYLFAIQSVCENGFSSYTNDYTFTTINCGTSASSYCEAYGTSTEKGWIRQVTFGPQLKVSGSNQGYQNYTDFIFRGVAGATHNIILYPGYPKASFPKATFWRIWIDYNQNNIFEEEELVLEKTSEVSPGIVGPPVVRGTIFIPLTYIDVATQMRIMMRQDDYGEACDVFENGEVEDYTMRIGQ